MRGALPPTPALLCVAHPGHELRVYAWLTLARPAVAVLTDGSGRSGRSRLPATRETLEETACTVGPFFGAMTDGAAYRAIMARDVAPFVEAADRLARCIAESGARSIGEDAAEGYNPVHDVRRFVINSACGTLGVENYEFPLVGRLAGASFIACSVSDLQSIMAVRFPCKCGALSSKLPLSCARPRYASVKWP